MPVTFVKKGQKKPIPSSRVEPPKPKKASEPAPSNTPEAKTTPPSGEQIAAKNRALSVPELAGGNEGRPDLKEAIKVGDWTILPDIDPHDVLSGTKFFVHLWKRNLWYRIVGFDDVTNEFKLVTESNYKFDSKIHRTIGPKYMVVQGPIDALVPSPEILERVWSLMEHPSDDVPWATPPKQAHDPGDNPHHGHDEREDSPEPAPAPKAKKAKKVKKVKIVIPAKGKVRVRTQEPQRERIVTGRVIFKKLKKG